jgi:uncharacterized cupin superfamily protein
MSTTETTPLKQHVSDAPVEPVPIPEQSVIAGSLRSAMTILWRSHDGRLYNGVWHCTPGIFMLTHPAETICVVEGRVTITPQGGDPLELGPGDLAFIPEGTVARWEVHETIKKAFHSHDSTGTMLGPLG